MSNQIIKLQKNGGEARAIKVATKNWYGCLYEDTDLSEMFSIVFEKVLISNPEFVKNWEDNKVLLANLTKLIYEGYALKIIESNKVYVLIVSKGKSSTSFSASKEYGISRVIIQAEDWAQTFVEDLKTNTSCGV